jgi:hypothetical protein
MIGGMFTLYDLIAHREWRTSLRVGAAGLMALIVVLPHLAAIAQLASSGEYSPDHSPRKHAADISYFFIPSTIQRVGEIFGDDSHKRLLHVGESSLYLPISMVLMALSCAYHRRVSGKGRSRSIALFMIAAIFYLLSLGPLITFFGDKIAVSWMFIGFDKVLPLFPSVPARFAGIGYVLFLLGITIAARDIKGSLRSKGIIFGLVIALCEIYPAQVPVRELAVSQSLLSKLREVPPGPVLDLSRIPQDAMMRQIAHHRPLVGGFLSRRPKKEVASLRRNFFYRYVREGVDSADSEIVAGWQALGAPVVVVPKTDVSKEVLNRLSQLQFREVLDDGALILIIRDAR